MLELFHTGFLEIREPDVRHGRTNADFGQGFYLTPDAAFARRWARTRAGEQTVVNRYLLDTEGLTVHTFQRDAAWFDYIYANRSFRPVTLSADVIVGPIANDTIYDVWGITTSGFLSPEQSLTLLRIGPEYRQVAVKTERAAAQLRWQSARVLPPEEIAGFRDTVRREEEAFQQRFLETMNGMEPGI